MPGPGVIVTERGVERGFWLPAELSSLVGRGPQITAILDGLRTARVVTLTGPGGCGKTRLALRAAALAADGFEDDARLAGAGLADRSRVRSRARHIRSCWLWPKLAVGKGRRRRQVTGAGRAQVLAVWPGTGGQWWDDR